MKITLLCILLLALYNKTFSQSLINTCGQTLQSNVASVEFSIGEISIATLSDNQQSVTQGLLQPILQFKGCNLLLSIPNAFTPNRDNLNDYFGVKNWPATSSFELTVYNRWGQLVFKTNNLLEGWNGEFNGQLQPAGTYLYFIKANTTACGLVNTKGTILLIR